MIMHKKYLWEWIHLQERQLYQQSLLLRRKFFSFTEELISKMGWCTEKAKDEIVEVIPLCKNDGESTTCIQSPY